MKKIINWMQDHPALVYALLFLLVMIPSLLLYLAARMDSLPGLILGLGVAVLANLGAVFFRPR